MTDRTQQPDATERAVARSRLRWRVLLPLYYVVAFATLWIVQVLRIDHTDAPAIVFPVGLGLALVLEIVVTFCFERRARVPGGRAMRVLAQVAMWLGLALRLGYWGLLFFYGAEYLATVTRTDGAIFLRIVGLRLWKFAPVALSLVPWLSVVLFAAWLGLVEGVVIRKRQLRGIVVMVLPVFIFAALTLAGYHWGTTDKTAAEVAAQESVRVLFDVHDLAPPAAEEAWDFPRHAELFGDGRALVGSFGQTLGGPVADRQGLWKVDLDSGSSHWITTENQVWAFSINSAEDTLYAFPWHQPVVLRIDLETFVVTDTIRYDEIWPYPSVEPTYAQAMGRDIFVTMTAVPSVLRFDTETERFVGTLDLSALGLARDGDTCCGLAVSPTDGTLYAMASSHFDTTIVRIDPERFEVVDHGVLEMNGMYLAARPTPEGDDVLYVGQEFRDGLWRVDTETWRGEVAYETDTKWQTRLLWDPVSDRILLFGRTTGTMIELTPDCEPVRSVWVGRAAVPVTAGADGITVMSTVGVLRIDRASPDDAAERSPDDSVGAPVNRALEPDAIGVDRH